MSAPRKNPPPAPPEKPEPETRAPEPGLTAQRTNSTVEDHFETLFEGIEALQKTFPGKWSHAPVSRENAGDVALLRKFLGSLTAQENNPTKRIHDFCWYCRGKLIKRPHEPESLGLLEKWLSDFCASAAGGPLLKILPQLRREPAEWIQPFDWGAALRARGIGLQAYQMARQAAREWIPDSEAALEAQLRRLRLA